MYYFTLSESGLAILHFLFLREVINELAVGGGKMELRTRDCTAAQICSVQPQGTIFAQSSMTSNIMKSTKKRTSILQIFNWTNVPSLRIINWRQTS